MAQIKRFSEDTGEWDEPVIVKVNGKEYKTQLYDGVQRFIPNSVVQHMVYTSIEQSYSEADLNSIVLRVLQGELPFEDYVEFQTMHGYSVEGFCDAIESNVGFNPQLFPGEIEDWFIIENPLWD